MMWLLSAGSLTATSWTPSCSDMANHRLNLSGRIFGDLEVLEPAGLGPRGATLWRCKCHRCGNEALMVGHRLTTKRRPAQDCGCRCKDKRADLSGKTYGAITAIDRVGTYKSGDALYRCRCNICGKEINLPACSIKAQPKSCGCTHHTSQKMAEKSKLGVAANIVNGANLNCIFNKNACKNSKTGVRGVYPESGRPGQYRYSVRVCGETVIKTGFTSIESAQKERAAKQAELIEKYGVKRPPWKQEE